MATTRQKSAARRNIRRAQQRWKSMSHREHALAQPQGRGRTRPGLGGKGKYFRIQVRPKEQFVSFRTHDVGENGHTQRLAGRRKSGSWDTQAWLVAKRDAHVQGNRLVLDRADIKKSIRGPITHVKGDIFRAKPRRDVPEREKPTAAMRRAQRTNIRKAQRARRALVG